MSRGRHLWYAFLAGLARAVLWLIWRSCRVVAVSGEERLDALVNAGAPGIIVHWHQMQLFCTWLLIRKARQGLPVATLISPSVSGDLGATILRRLGINPVRGSSTRSAGEVLRDLYQALVTDGRSVVITADGPKGPLHQCKPGAILLSRMSDAPVIPMAFAARPCRYWGSWDRFIVPWPFARVAVVVGEPWAVPRDFTLTDLPRLEQELGTQLNRLADEAGALLDK